MANTIADVIQNQQQLDEQARQDAYARMMGIAQFGKGIWDTIQEKNKYKPGSDYMNAQELANKTWPQENAAYSAGLEQSAIDYKNQHPGKTAAQLTAEWMGTPEGQAYQKSQTDSDTAQKKLENYYRMMEINAAGKYKEGGKTQYMDPHTALNAAIANAAAKYQMPKDSAGDIVWKPGPNKEKIRTMMSRFINYVDPAFQDSTRQLINDWVDSEGKPGPDQVPPPTDLVPPPTDVRKNGSAFQSSNPDVQGARDKIWQLQHVNEAARRLLNASQNKDLSEAWVTLGKGIVDPTSSIAKVNQIYQEIYALLGSKSNPPVQTQKGSGIYGY